MFLLFLAQAAAAPPARPPKLVPIFSYYDYPAEALRHHWEGTVVAEISVSADGNPTACRILKSSGHKILDDDLQLRDATCEVQTHGQRGHSYDPAGQLAHPLKRPRHVRYGRKADTGSLAASTTV